MTPDPPYRLKLPISKKERFPGPCFHPIQIFIRSTKTNCIIRKETPKILIIEEKASKYTQQLHKLLSVHRFPTSSCLWAFLRPRALGTYRVAPIFYSQIVVITTVQTNIHMTHSIVWQLDGGVADEICSREHTT